MSGRAPRTFDSELGCDRSPCLNGNSRHLAIAIVPGLFVAVVAARREELVQHCRQVLLESGLEFDRADGARAADVKDICHPGADA